MDMSSEQKLAALGVIHGRFQVLHNDHVKYLLAGKARCQYLVVGITDPDPKLTRREEADTARSELISNPLTYFERSELIRAALKNAGVSLEGFSTVPFPISFPELYANYVPLQATYYLTVYDDWGRVKRTRFEERGLRTEVLWERPLSEKGITASRVRGLMARGEDWEHLVPSSCVDLLKRWQVPKRIYQLHSKLPSE
jgi:nicotinamide-nucleotide adenylyltransferase